MPRFKFAAEYRLQEPLKQLGMVRAFMLPGAAGADFSGMSLSGKAELSISEVYHKAFVAVNEEGTEAAAATGVVGLKGEADPTPQFAGNRPFLFLIRDAASGTVLFVGRVADAGLIANTDRGAAEERSIKMARETPAKHPLFKNFKQASGLAILRIQDDPGGLPLESDDEQGLLLPCHVVQSLKGELKTGMERVKLGFSGKLQSESAAARSFCDFFSPSFGKDHMLVIYERRGNQLRAIEVIDADEAALLIAAHACSIPAENLLKVVPRR